jgi:hypothetical protein
MTEERTPTEDLRDLAERAMEDKREETGNESQTRELWDVPTETGADLAAQQEEGA